MKKFLYVLGVIALVAILISQSFSTAQAKPPDPVNVQILAVNDFHGAVDTSLTKPTDPLTGKPTTDQTKWYYRGGAEYLANFVDTAVATNPNTVKVSAGDMIGASPLLSAAFHDEPTIQAFNLLGFDYSAVGNHEFDEGWQELLRMQNGGCHPVDGCYSGVPEFTGANFEYLTANVVRLDKDKLLFKAYSVKKIGGVKVGFISVSLESTPTIVVPSSVEGLEFTAEVAAINQYAKMFKDEMGIQAIVVLLHNGSVAGPTINSCKNNGSVLRQYRHESRSRDRCPDHRPHAQRLQLPGSGQCELRPDDRDRRWL